MPRPAVEELIGRSLGTDSTITAAVGIGLATSTSTIENPASALRGGAADFVEVVSCREATVGSLATVLMTWPPFRLQETRSSARLALAHRPSL